MLSASLPDDRAIDPDAVERQFDRRAAAFARSDFLHREVERRLFEHLEAVRIAPQRILDVGCGPGRSFPALAVRFPSALIVGIDCAQRALQAALQVHKRDWPRRLKRAVMRSPPAPAFAQARFDALPVRTGSVDMIFSNLALHWAAQPHRVVPEWTRALRTDGLIAFSCFGPDTLHELREAAEPGSVVGYVDMHDLGDMLVDSGCVAPVVDMEHITLTYPSAEAALRELRAVAGNPLAGRISTLTGRGRRRTLLERLERLRVADGRLHVTIEVIYGHAWKAAPRQHAERLPDGRTEVHVPFPAVQPRAGSPR